MRKPLHVTIDYPDDIESAGGWYARRHIGQSMARFRELGISRVYWISYHDSMLRDRMADDASSLTRAVVDAGHAQGLKVYALFKPFEMGLWAAVPHFVPLPDDVRGLSSPSGLHPLAEAFVLDHPEMRMKRRSLENDGRNAAMIKLVKANAEPTRLDADGIEIWTSPVNGAFTRYEGRYAFSDTVEQRDGTDCRVLALASLELPQNARYILVQSVARSDRAEFINDHDRIMEVYDTHGRRMVANHDEGAMRMNAPTGLDSLRRALKLLGLWKHGDPDRYLSIVPEDYGAGPAQTGYAFCGDGRRLQGQRALDGSGACSPQDGVAVRALVEKGYLCGALHPCHPEVRQHWLSRIRDCIDAGVDGLDIRISNHSSWAPDGEEYGFNEPAVSEFRARYGVDVLTEDFDTSQWKDLQHEHWMMFLREARGLVKSHGLPLQLHVTSQFGKPDSSLNNVPCNFNWDWQRWITEDDLCDAIHLKWPQIDMDFAAQVASFAKSHGKQVTFSLRLQYPMNGEQNDVLRDRMRWAEDNDNIDAIVFYEKDCFTTLDKARDEVAILPAMEELLT